MNHVAEHQSRQQSLEAAFAYFNETSAFLAESYAALEKKVQQLTGELDQVSAARAEEAKEKNALENKLSALLDFLPGGVIVLDSRGYIIQCNPAARDLLQVSLEGKLWRQVISESFAPKNDDGFEVSTRSGRRVSLATASLGVEGQIILLTDQTETRRLQESLSRNEKLSAMGKMVSALAHQIRTPLSAALLYGGHLCHSELQDDKRQQFSEKLLGRLQHMEKQVRDMLLFVKQELPLNDICRVDELSQSLKEACEVAISSSSATCHWHIESSNDELKCNRDALVSALANLINNSIQSSKRSVNISVSFSVSNAWLSICIEDDGDGMDAETLQKIQEPFTTTKSQGTGLGLAVVRSIARAHGAEFELSSELNIGTKAHLILPLRAQ